ncbi:MAG TPA: PAS domain S-box protein [Herpetosiphonaceae bacterium]|nr:PAS domain S-box protein [Herpetosiphonaceae bacterium]
MEEALRASEERWRVISQLTSDYSYAYLLQPGGTIIRQWTTGAFTRITGYAPEEMDARGWEHLYHSADQHLFAARLEAVGSGRPDVSEFRILTRSGEVRWVLDSARPLFGVAPDAATLVYGAVQDITERKRAEAALQASECKYRLLMEQAADGIFVADADGNYIEVNPTGCRMLGYTREEMLDRNIRDLIPADDQARTPIRWTALHSGESIIAERRLLRKDGTLLPVELSAKRLDNGDLQALVRDITARKQAEARLQESERRLAEAQRLAHLGAWEWDIRTNQVTWSDELYRIFGLQPRQFDATYETFLHHVHPDDRPIVGQAVQGALEGRHPHVNEHRIVRSDGVIRFIRPQAEIKLDAQGRPVRMVGTAHDVTEQKEVEIRAQREAARTEVLLRVAARLNAELEVDAVLNALCEETARVLEVPIVYVVLHEPGGAANVYAAGLGIPPAYARRPLPVPHTFYDAYRRAPDRIIILDVSAVAGAPNAELYEALAVRTTVMMNIVRQRALIGALVIMTRDVVRDFTDDELALLRGLADQAAQAVTTAQLFEQVRTSRERMRRLTRQVVSAQEEERRRLSRELHDEAGQALTGLEISLKLIDADLPSSPPGLRRRLTDAIALTGATMDQIRLLAQDLRPPALDAVGLNLTLEGYCRGFAARTGLAVDYAGMEMPELPDTVNITLYRVLQEALTNVAKHARARRVRVALGHAVGTLMLLIEDDGRGLDKQALAAGSRPTTGIGLIGMQERVELLGGRLEIDAGRGHGTRLAAYVPLE